MTAATVSTGITAQDEANLWNKLRTHFLNFQDVLEEIIEKEAWIESGFGSFTEAWTAKMGDITLAAEFRIHVVYQMLAEGVDVDTVAASVKGVGPGGAASLKRQRDYGVPADHAALGGRRWHNKPGGSTIVREHERGPKSEARVIHLDIGPTRLKRYQKIAKRIGLTVEEIALAAVEEKFQELRG